MLPTKLAKTVGAPDLAPRLPDDVGAEKRQRVPVQRHEITHGKETQHVQEHVVRQHCISTLLLNRTATHGAGSLLLVKPLLFKPLLDAALVEDVSAVELVVGVFVADRAQCIDLLELIIDIHLVMVERRIARVNPILHLLLKCALVHGAQMV